MKRLGLLVAIAAAVVALVDWGAPATWPAAPVPVASPYVGPPGRGSVWYCAAGGGDGVAHQIVVANIGDEPLHARVVGYGDAATDLAPVAIVRVAARDRAVVDVADTLGSGVAAVVVELAGGSGFVEHRLLGGRSSDVDRCTTQASTRAYFPIVDTAKDLSAGATTPASARLWVFNPFPTDANVDVEVGSEESVRVPPALRGVVVPGGTVRSIELGEQALQLRSQGTVAVRASAGRIVAELAQTGDGVGAGEGLRLQMGVSRPTTRWVFADGFAGAGVTERYVVMNPSATDVVTVEVAVGANVDESLRPEPFVREVEPRRFQVVDLHTETRLPEAGLRWVTVTASGGGVVVARSVALDRAAADGTGVDRPDVANGLAGSAGSAVEATKWAFGSAGLEDGRQVVAVANPDAEAIAVVQLEILSGGKRRPIGEAFEVRPGTSFAVDVTDAVGSPGGVLVLTAQSPVVAELRTTSASRVDLSVTTGTPVGLAADR